MTIEIVSNSDMPPCLNTDVKQKKAARRIAEHHFKKPVKSTSRPNIQGFFSRTVFVTFVDQTQKVIQFRPEPLDITPYVTAKKALGDVVPSIGLIRDDELEKDNVSTYFMTMIPGKIWARAIAGNALTALPIINKSLGEIFAGGYLQDRCDEVVDQQLLPHLELILDSELAFIKPFKPTIKKLLQSLDSLKKLPLWITHFDLNEVNVLLGNDFKVTGLVDWELSFPQPFGVFLGRIHTLAGQYHDGEFHMTPVFEEAERALWNALYTELSNKLPAHAAKTILDHPEAVQLAVIIGTVLDVFQKEDGRLLENPGVSIKALPKFLSYRIPAIRGNDSPYTE